MTEASTAEHAAGRRIKALRVVRGWSQQELAMRMSGLGHAWRQTTVTKTESADRPLRVNEAVHLANVFGVPVGDLLGAPHQDSNAAIRDALIAAARQRVQQCERAKKHAEDELAEAVRELDRLAAVQGSAEMEARNG